MADYLIDLPIYSDDFIRSMKLSEVRNADDQSKCEFFFQNRLEKLFLKSQ